MLEDEIQYIRQAQEGNQQAFAALYGHYLPKIYRFIFLKVNNRTEAEDLTHEVFLNSWQNIQNYTYQSFPFSSWLYRIARNEVIDFYRTNKNNVRLENLEEDKLKVSEKESQNLNQTLEIEQVRNFIKLLKPEHQDVLIMRFVEDLSHQEIAAAIKKSEGAVRLIQHRAMNALKDLISKKENDNRNFS